MTPPRVQSVQFEGRRAWLKRYDVEPRRLRMAALRAFARLFDTVPLRPPPTAADAAAACRTEREMIERLDALGARVPRILDAKPTSLVLSHLGATLSAACKHETSPERRLQLLESGFDALTDLHRRGGFLSQAVARNIAVDDKGVGFIDLEENPLEVMPLPAAQARDLLLYVQSTARFAAPAAYGDVLHQALQEAEPEVRAQVGKVARKLAWAAPLAALVGTRGRALSAALRLLARTTLLLLLGLAAAEWSEEAVRLADLILDDVM